MKLTRFKEKRGLKRKQGVTFADECHQNTEKIVKGTQFIGFLLQMVDFNVKIVKGIVKTKETWFFM